MTFFLVFVFVFDFLLHRNDQIVFFIEMDVEVFFCHTGGSHFYGVTVIMFDNIDGGSGSICFLHPFGIEEIIENVR